MSRARKSTRAKPARPRRAPSRHRPARKTMPAPAPEGPARTASSGLAPGMHEISAYLAVADVGASMAFLEQTFGFTRGVVLPDATGAIRYAEMRHGASAVVLVPRGEADSATGGAPGLYTYVGDVDRVLDRAREAGVSVGEAADRPWGDRTATVTDPDGYQWVLATFRKLAAFE